MGSSDFSTEDICDFAQYMGLKGVDSDLFFEAYYELDSDALELELELAEETEYDFMFQGA